MYNTYKFCPCDYCAKAHRHDSEEMYEAYGFYQYPYYINPQLYNQNFFKPFGEQHIPLSDEMWDDLDEDTTQSQIGDRLIKLKDYGPQPFVVDINEATKQNNTFRTTLWTGKHLQVTLMSIKAGDDIGLEIHPKIDQFIRVEEGQGIVKMGRRKDKLDFEAKVYDEFAIMIPAGTWHNIINTGNKPLKVYSIYAPPQHPHGAVHVTKADAKAAEKKQR